MTFPAATMRDYAVAKTGALLDEAAAAITSAARTPDEEAVHKMRVSIRRLQQAIRLFRQYFDSRGFEHVKDRMRAIMEVAGELRNRDIAMKLVADADGDTGELAAQRLAYKEKLDDVLKRYLNSDLSRSWREKLGMDAQ